MRVAHRWIWMYARSIRSLSFFDCVPCTEQCIEIQCRLYLYIKRWISAIIIHSTSPNLHLGTTRCRLSATAHSIYLHLRSIPGWRLFHAQTENQPYHGDNWQLKWQTHLLWNVCWKFFIWRTMMRPFLGYWIKRDQLDFTCFIISLFNAQHVSDVNTSILRSLRPICWVVWYPYAGFSLHSDTTPPQPNHTVTPTHIEPEQYNPWNNSTNKSQAPEDGCINIRNMLSSK